MGNRGSTPASTNNGGSNRTIRRSNRRHIPNTSRQADHIIEIQQLQQALEYEEHKQVLSDPEFKELVKISNGPSNTESRGAQANNKKGQRTKKSLERKVSSDLQAYREDKRGVNQCKTLADEASTEGAKRVFQRAGEECALRVTAYKQRYSPKDEQDT